MDNNEFDNSYYDTTYTSSENYATDEGYSNRTSNKNKKKTTRTAVNNMPNNREAEQHVLGAILVDGLLGQEAAAVINEDDFYSATNSMIFFHMKQLMHASIPIDVVALSDSLDKASALDGVGGVQFLFDLYNKIASTANFKHYIDIVKRDGTLRKLIRACSEISDSACSSTDLLGSMALAEKKLFEITFQQDIQDLFHVSDGVNIVLKETEELMRSPIKIRGLETGFKNLDNVTHGYKEGQMIVLAARPGCGKTSLAMNIATNVAMAHPEKVVAVFNLEMSLSELTQRMLFSVSGVTQDMVYKGEDTGVFDKLWAAKQRLDKTKLFVDDTAAATPDKIASKLRRLKQKQKRLDFVVIDYLQLLRLDKSLASLQHEVTEISRAIKLMAKELKVPILILSQTSRGLERREDKTPMLSDLRDSGAIEQDADQVYFLTKEDTDFGAGFEVVNLNIVKNRSGSTATLPLKWEGNLVRFTDMDKLTYEQLKDEAKLREKPDVPVKGKNKDKQNAESQASQDRMIEEQARYAAAVTAEQQLKEVKPAVNADGNTHSSVVADSATEGISDAPQGTITADTLSKENNVDIDAHNADLFGGDSGDLLAGKSLPKAIDIE